MLPTASTTPSFGTACSMTCPSWKALRAGGWPRPRRPRPPHCWRSRPRRWCSARGTAQGEGGGLGAKFPRVLVSEIMGIDTPVEAVIRDRRTNRAEPQTAGRRTGSRIDPLGVLRKVDVFKSPTGWSTDQQEAGKNAKKVRPSEINHGNIRPTVVPLGVTCEYAEHRVVLTLAGLRRLRFGDGERNAAGRALLAALGLLAIAEQDARGYALRSRCDLVCDGAATLELVHADGSTEAGRPGSSGGAGAIPGSVRRCAAGGFRVQYDHTEATAEAGRGRSAQPRAGLGRRRAQRPERVSLVLEIEFLAGVCRTTHSPASTTPDWPPQPDRVFSALVSAWAARGERRTEREALEWLEALRAPAIHAGRHTARTAPNVFVPPNDQRSSQAAKTYIKVMPAKRTRQPRRFPVAHLDDPVMAMVWETDPEPKILASLEALARDISYIGHSASIVRCRFLSCGAPSLKHAAAPCAATGLPRPPTGADTRLPRQPDAAGHPAWRHRPARASRTAAAGRWLAGPGGDRWVSARHSRGHAGGPHVAAHPDEWIPPPRHGRPDTGARVRTRARWYAASLAAPEHHPDGVRRLPARGRPRVRVRPGSHGTDGVTRHSGTARCVRGGRTVRSRQ